MKCCHGTEGCEGRGEKHWCGDKPAPAAGSMTRAQLKALKEETALIEARTEALKRNVEAMRAEAEVVRKQTDELARRNARVYASAAKRAYQSEIHAVALNVLVGILTKDALRAMRESDFAASKLDVGQVVEYSLIVGKRYIDELHKIAVSDKQVAEYRDHIIATTVSLPSMGPTSPEDAQ